MVIPYQTPLKAGRAGARQRLRRHQRVQFRAGHPPLHGECQRRRRRLRRRHSARPWMPARPPSVDYRIDYLYPCLHEREQHVPVIERLGSPFAAGLGLCRRRQPSPPAASLFGQYPFYATSNGTITGERNDTTLKFIEIPINDDNLVQFNEDLLVQLSLPGPTYPDAGSDRSLGYVQTCNLTILFNDQPAGAADLTYNPENYANTHPAYNSHPGPNSTVYSHRHPAGWQGYHRRRFHRLQRHRRRE